MKYILIFIIFFFSASYLSGQSYSKRDASLIEEAARLIRSQEFAKAKAEKIKILKLLTSKDATSNAEARLYDDMYVFFDFNGDAIDYNIKGLVKFTATGNPDDYILFCPKSATIIPISGSDLIVLLKPNKRLENFFKDRFNTFFLKENEEINAFFDNENEEIGKFFREEIGTLYLYPDKEAKLQAISLDKKKRLMDLFLKKKEELKNFLSNERDNEELKDFFSKEEERIKAFSPKENEELERFFSKEEENLKKIFFKERARVMSLFPDGKEELQAFYPAQITDIKDVHGSSYKAYYIHLVSYDEVLQFVKKRIR